MLSSSREARIRVPTFSVVYFSSKALSHKGVKEHYWGTLRMASFGPPFNKKPKNHATPTWGCAEASFLLRAFWFARPGDLEE